RGAANQLQYIVAVLIDVTEQRQAKQALEASEQRYRLHFQGAFDGVSSCTDTGAFLDANPAFCQMLGYTAEELQRLTLDDVVDDGVAMRRHVAEVLFHGGDRFETRLRAKDGRRVEVEISSAELTLNGSSILHSISRDITERKHAEESVRYAEETLREERDFHTTVLETADALIFVLDPGGRIVRFNGKCTALSGYREEEVRGRVFWEFLLPAQWIDPVRDMFQRLTQEHLPLVFENPWLTRAGEERLIAWRNTAVHDAHGGLRYVIGTGIDITDQRRLEDQLRQAQ